jgi:hypothetical protein
MKFHPPSRQIRDHINIQLFVQFTTVGIKLAPAGKTDKNYRENTGLDNRMILSTVHYLKLKISTSYHSFFFSNPEMALPE